MNFILSKIVYFIYKSELILQKSALKKYLSEALLTSGA